MDWNIWVCHSFWRPLCFSRVARGAQFVGTWLHGNLYIVHYKGFACAEIWNSYIQSEAVSLLYPEMLEMPSLCVSRKIYTETPIWPVVFDGSTKTTMGAWESLGTVILSMITDYRIFLIFFHGVNSGYWERCQASCCGNIVHSMETHIFIHHYWPQNSRCIFYCTDICSHPVLFSLPVEKANYYFHSLNTTAFSLQQCYCQSQRRKCACILV